ncbi:MAG: YlxR family protein [Eubacterium sp.]|nr:YlxR family protein [Eubacterium sp.]
MEGSKRKPVRTCIGCRKRTDKDELIRIVFDGQDQVSLDPAKSMPGRGAYVCNDRGCFERLIKTKALGRAFRMTVPERCYEYLEEEIDKRFK